MVVNDTQCEPMTLTVPSGQTEFSIHNASGKNWSTPWKTGKTDAYHRYDPMIRNFAELVRGKENPYSYDYELNLYKLVLKSCGRDV